MTRDELPPPGADEVEAGDHSGVDAAFERIYPELRSLARLQLAHERQGHTLQATALVHDAYLRLLREGDPTTANPAHFYRAAARAMRRILIEHARKKGRQRRGGGARKVSLDVVELAAGGNLEDVLAVDDAIRRLEDMDPEAAEVVRLRCFVGFSVEEIAQALGQSVRTVGREWSYARTWLQRSLGPDSS